MTNKQKYREFCQSEVTIPIFSRDWWLDAVCGENNWDVVLIEKGNQIRATLPYYKNIKYGLCMIRMPQLTQTMGPWIALSTAKYAKQLSDQKSLMGQLIEQLPTFDFFSQNFHYSITNWLPYYWAEFSQTSRYTYVLENLTDEKMLWDGLLPNIRTDIKKATNRYHLNISFDFDVNTFLDINELTFKRQNKALPYSRKLVHSIFDACSKQNACKMFFAVDQDGRIHAANFIVWDENSAYYLMGGGDPELRNSGATSLLMWESIRFASTVTKKFDFEGSMIEPVERFFRAFGARQIPYFQVSKTNTLFVKMYRDIRSWGGMLKTLVRNRAINKSSANDS